MTVDISIFTLSERTFTENEYFIKWLVPEWQAAGLRVAVCDAPADAMRAAVVISHLDASRVDESLSAALNGHPMVLNRANTDIRKSRISRNLIRRRGDCAGPVLVKTDLNYGGLPERRFGRGRTLTSRLVGRLRRCLPWHLSGILSPMHYRVYPSADHVPRLVWSNPALVVERFLPEMIDGHYCLRHHFFFGDRHCDFRLLAKDPIVKSSRVVACERMDETPPDVIEVRRRLQMDYGRFDYVLHEGRAIVFDANRTPAFTFQNRSFPHAEVGRHLAAGIWSVLPSAAAVRRRATPGE